MNTQKYFLILGMSIWFFSILSLFVITFQTTLTALTFITCMMYLSVTIIYLNSKIPLVKTRFYLLIFSISIFLFFLITNYYNALIIFHIMCFAIGLIEFTQFSKKNIYFKFLVAIPFFSLIGISIFLGANALNPDFFAKIVQNSVYMPIHQISATNTYGTSYFRTNDIMYSSNYENSFFDLYSNDNNHTTLKPVLVFLHGGGWVFGDKIKGDITGKVENGYSNFIENAIDSGYSVISVNYALAPDDKYPIPLYQLNELMLFLKSNGEKYGIDSTNIVIGGSSAGAQLAGQFVTIQTNEQYAKLLNIPQTLYNNEIKGLFTNSGLLSPSNTANTGFLFTDYLYSQMARSYFNANILNNDMQAQKADFIHYVTENFPPTYITDGNFATYNTQAHLFDKILDKKGVEHTSFILDNQNELIFHDYNSKISKYTKQNQLNFSQFLLNL